MDKASIILGGITIVAIVAGPIAALWIQRKLDEGREERNRKLWIFKTLMSYRATALSPHFVQALNLIDVEFTGNTKDDKDVRKAWKVLLDHFGDLAGPTVPPNSAEKTAALTASLLLAMGKCLGYDFDEVEIKKGAYYPMGLGNVEQEQHALRRGLLELLAGRKRIPVGVFEDRFPEITLHAEPPAQRELRPEPPVRELRG